MSTAKYRIWTWMDLSSLCILLLYCISFDLIGLLYNIRNIIYNISTFGILRVKKCHDSCIVHHCSVCRNQQKIGWIFCRMWRSSIVLIGSQIWVLSNSPEISLQTLSALQVVNCLFFPRRKVLKWTLVRRTGHWFPETLLALEWPWSYQAAQEISWAPQKKVLHGTTVREACNYSLYLSYW